MKAKNLPVGLRILFGFLSLILCVALFATSVLAIVLADVRVLTSEDNLQIIISHVLFGTPIQKNPSVASQAVGGMKLEEPSGELTEAQKAIVSTLYDMFSEQYGEEVPFTENEVVELLNRSTLPAFLSEKMAGIMLDIYNGETTTTITGAEVVQLLEDNKALIEETFGIEVSEEYVSQIGAAVDEMDITAMVQNVLAGNPPINPGAPENGEGSSEEIGNVMGGPVSGDSFLSGSGSAMETFSGGVVSGLLSGKGTVQDIVDGGIPVILMAVREVTSVEALMVVLTACLILIGLLFVINLKQLRVAVRCVGVTTMLAGLPFAAATVVAFAVPSLFAGTVLSIAYLGLTLTAGVSIGVFGGGVVLIILGAVMTAVHKKNLRTPKAVAAEAAPAAPEMPVLVNVSEEEVAPEILEMAAVPEETVVEEAAEEAPVEEMPTMETPVEEFSAPEEVAEEVPEQV